MSVGGFLTAFLKNKKMKEEKKKDCRAVLQNLESACF